MVRAWLADCGNRAALWRFDLAAVDLTPAWGWDCFLDPTVKPYTGQSKANAKRSATPVSGAPRGRAGWALQRCRGVMVRSRTMRLSWAMWRSLRLAVRARRRRVAPPAHPQPPLTQLDAGEAWQGPPVPAPPAVELVNVTSRVFGGEIAFHVKRRRWPAKSANVQHGRCFSRGLESRVQVDQWLRWRIG